MLPLKRPPPVRVSSVKMMAINERIIRTTGFAIVLALALQKLKIL